MNVLRSIREAIQACFSWRSNGMKPSRRGTRDPWFCLPVVSCMLMDAGVSLGFQPAAYWSDPASMHEGNPAWAALLARGPAAFVGGFLLYCLLIAFLLVWLTGALQKLLGMFVLLAHSYGAASWCHVELPARTYWWALLGVLLAEALTFALYWHLSPVCGKRPPEAVGSAFISDPRTGETPCDESPS